jgi:hypothetical protein
MIGHFPTPYPDELFYSICARFQDRSRYANKQYVGLELFGAEAAAAAVDLPCRLNFLINNLPRGHRWTVSRIIDEHTLFPYFRPFLSPERISRVNVSMRGRGIFAAKIASGSAATSIRSPDWLRYCPKCSEEDKKSCGEPYWRRLHQVPGVEVCPIHHAFLENSSTRVRNRINLYDYVSAQSVISATSSRKLNTKDQMHQTLLQIARNSAWLLDQRHTLPDQQDIRRRYLRLLGDKGIANLSGWVRSKKLVQALENYYSPALLQSLQCGIRKSSLSNWASVLVRDIYRGKFHHPLQHLLLFQMLGHTAESFFSFPAEYSPFGDGPWPCLNPACDYYRKLVITRCRLSETISIASGVKQRVPVGTFACECGFTYRRRGADVSDDTYRVDWVEDYGPTWHETLRELWVDSSLRMEDISLRLCGKRRAEQRIKIEAERLELPFPRRYKNCRAANTYKKRSKSRAKQPPAKMNQSTRDSLREKRQRWLDILETNPTAPRTELRGKFQSVYRWLETRDRKWLHKHLPPRKDHSFDWAGLDDSLAPGVAPSAERIKCAEKPRRITIFAIGYDIDCYFYLKNYLARLPETAKAVERVLETRIEFAKRKLHLAALAISERGEILTRAKLLKKANVFREQMRDPGVQAALESAIHHMSEEHRGELKA